MCHKYGRCRFSLWSRSKFAVSVDSGWIMTRSRKPLKTGIAQQGFRTIRKPDNPCREFSHQSVRSGAPLAISRFFLSFVLSPVCDSASGRMQRSRCGWLTPAGQLSVNRDCTAVRCWNHHQQPCRHQLSGHLHGHVCQRTRRNAYGKPSGKLYFYRMERRLLGHELLQPDHECRRDRHP
jgi:hypothetical protein